MLKHIFLFEFNQWFNKPLIYIYAIILGGIGLLVMGASGGLFDSSTATVSAITMINSPLQLCIAISGYSYLAYFLLPSIIGATLQKDFNSNMYKVLYSYPFGKRDYIFGKFLSSFSIASIVFLFIGVGTHIGTLLDGVDQSVVLPFDGMAYAKTYLIWILPNVFLFSAIVFAVTLYTRSVIAGFVALALIFFIQGMTDVFLTDADYEKLGALLDPFGLGALNNYTKYWTIIEQNENPLPIFGMVLYNRLIWIGIAVAIFTATYIWFSFSYTPQRFTWWRTKEVTRSVSTKPGGLINITLPDSHYHYGLWQGLQSAWALTRIDLKYVLRGGPFIVVSIIGILFIIIISAVSGQIFQTSTLPVTRQILMIPGVTFSILIALLTFIYVGLLIHKPETDGIFQLEDASPTPTWSTALSKLWSIIIMQSILLGIIMLTGIAIQIYHGYYNFEIPLYLTDLYGIRLINYINWALLAILVYNLVPNFYVGFMILMLIGIGMNFVSRLGIEQDIYKFNDGPGVRYSDMSGFGRRLLAHWIFKLYWFSLGLTFFFLSILFWRRGVRTTLMRRLRAIRQRMQPVIASLLTLSFLTFLMMAGWLYYQFNIVEPYVPSKVREERQIQYEKIYKRFESAPQPTLVDVNLSIDLRPETQDIRASGTYKLVNRTDKLIDSVFVGTNGMVSDFRFDLAATRVVKDTLYDVHVFYLPQGLGPGQELTLTFALSNKKNTIFHADTPVRSNGTFFNNYTFPVIGYLDLNEVTDKKIRNKYGLAEKEIMKDPSDSIARMSNYISTNSDWIQFEAIVSTSPDQIAMVPGRLQREWEADGRRYFHYKMNSKMLHFYNVISARYETFEDTWQGIPITIYYHQGHEYNLERIMKGAKAGLAYCSENFSPYQHDQLRILEFPISEGTFAQSFANTVPFSEGIGFIADVDDSEEGGVDYPFAVTVHEVAHQWWAHQVIGANTKGSTMMSESLSEYVSLMVLQHTYGKEKMRQFLKDALDKYLMARTVDRQEEQPLMRVENQPHIHYNKGSLVFYALADYIGEQTLNDVLRAYVDSVGFQNPPFTISDELVGMIREVVPDSLDYLIDDMFAHITLYDNRVTDATYTQIGDQQYEVKISTQTTKYRTGGRGKRIYKNEYGDSLAVQIEGSSRETLSLPLKDYIDIGVFGIDDEGKETILHLNKYKVESIEGQYTLIVDEVPIEVGIDPYNKLIDTNSEDNRKKLIKN